jgi:hypothetical protein
VRLLVLGNRLLERADQLLVADLLEVDELQLCAVEIPRLQQALTVILAREPEQRFLPERGPIRGERFGIVAELAGCEPDQIPGLDDCRVEFHGAAQPLARILVALVGVVLSAALQIDGSLRDVLVALRVQLLGLREATGRRVAFLRLAGALSGRVARWPRLRGRRRRIVAIVGENGSGGEHGARERHPYELAHGISSGGVTRW